MEEMKYWICVTNKENWEVIRNKKYGEFRENGKLS